MLFDKMRKNTWGRRQPNNNNEASGSSDGKTTSGKKVKLYIISVLQNSIIFNN